MSMSLNQEFTPLKLLRFAAPSIIMMIFMSMYTIIDGGQCITSHKPGYKHSINDIYVNVYDH